MSDNLDTLRKTAENAHSVLPEPWIVMGDSNTVSVVELSHRDGSIISGGAVADAHTTPFRDHIATFDPGTVLALLSRLEQAEQAVQRVREVANNNRATKHESAMYLHPLEILKALDGDVRG